MSIMSVDLSTLRSGAARELEPFKGLGFVEDTRTFGLPQYSFDQQIVEVQDLITGYDPSHPGTPVLENMPQQSREATGIIIDDIQATFPRGLYVLRFLFRQGDVEQSLDPGFHRPHADFNGRCRATYAVSNQAPTVGRLGKKRFQGDPYQVVRMRGDLLHNRPPVVRLERTTVVANVIDQNVFNSVSHGLFAFDQAIAGASQPVRYAVS